MLGLVVLVVPGIVLIVRWLPAYAILLSENTRVTEALGQSWERTQSQFWPVLAAVLIVFAFGVGAAVLYALSDIAPAVPFEVATIGGNFALSLISAVFTALGVAVYGLLAFRSALGRSDLPHMIATLPAAGAASGRMGAGICFLVPWPAIASGLTLVGVPSAHAPTINSSLASSTSSAGSSA